MKRLCVPVLLGLVTTAISSGMTFDPGQTEFKWWFIWQGEPNSSTANLYLDSVGVKFVPGTSAERRSQIVAEVGFLRPLAEAGPLGGDLYLAMTRNCVTALELLEGINRLNEYDEVRYATPVFQNAEMLTDRLYASFPDFRPEVELEALHSRYGLEIEERVHRVETHVMGYWLRLTKASPGNTLDIVNAYVLEHDANASPSFAHLYPVFNNTDEDPTNDTPPPSRDINGTGAVDAGDVQAVVNSVLGHETPYNADTDDDCDVTALDVQAVVNAVLGL